QPVPGAGRAGRRAGAAGRGRGAATAAAADPGPRDGAAVGARAVTSGAVTTPSWTLGTLRVSPALSRPDLLAAPVAAALQAWDGPAGAVGVAEIDPSLADTAAFCEAYGVALEDSANCVVV